MSIELKIKHKHLALEPQLIRHEERKLKQQMKHHSVEEPSYRELSSKLHSLTNHRKMDVRREARATHLARTYLKGKPYKSAEQSRNPIYEHIFNVYILSRAHAMIRKYGSGEQRKIEMHDLMLWAKQ